MKQAVSGKKLIAKSIPGFTMLLAIMLAIAVASSMFWQDISMFLFGRSQTADQKVLADGTALCEDIVEEGVVLLKNEKDKSGNYALPLSEEEMERVNVFGWAAYDWMTMAFGSGYSNTALAKLKLFPALDAAGIEYNKTLYNMYKNFYSDASNVYNTKEDEQEYRGGVSFGSEKIFTLHEPGAAYYTDEVISEAADFSDVALVVLGRTGSESKDLKQYQVKQEQKNKSTKNVTDNSRHYLELSTEEEEMIAAAQKACSKVIVILNTANTMETGFIDDEGIDGALLVGLTGLTGVNGLINVIRGEKESKVVARDEEGNIRYNEDGTVIYEKDAAGNEITETVKVSPSGRTVDTYAYDLYTAPAAVNQGESGPAKTYTGYGGDGSAYRAYVDYSEGIYVGYKWYETADAEGYWNDVTNEYGEGYAGVVQYPFGYGLSYTQFEWNVTHIYINGEEQRYNSETVLGKNDTIEIYVSVKNTGDYPGMDVVELYYTAPYTAGGIEKPYVSLGAFAKTGVIESGESDIVKLELTVQSMASYDCYDANGNGHTGYELDGGVYSLRLMKNAHENGTMADKSKTDAVIKYSIPSSGYNYDTDETTGESVENRFTNKDGNGNDEVLDNNDLDGSRESVPVKYLSRSDFDGTYPKNLTARARTSEAASVAKAGDPTAEQLKATGYVDLASPKVVDGDLTFNDLLGVEDFDDPIWEEAIEQIPYSELYTLVSDGYFKTAALPSIEKPEFVDLDGPLGFNTRVTGGTNLCEFVAYPGATLLAQTWNTDLAYAMGLSVGREASSMPGLNGWYAPGANIHRNPFGGRNGEYYSEDAFLSGLICAGTVKGAKDMGVHSYVKHFVANDSELNREGLFTFMTEQTLREIYLRPFELMIKQGGGNALMTAMNRLGRVWSGANYGLITEIVRGEWGFRGGIVTDWINASDTYMPAVKGLWAGNDMWLSNGIPTAFNSLKDYSATDVAFMRNAAHDVLFMLVDTENARQAYNPNSEMVDYSKGAEYNTSWVAGIVLIEAYMAIIFIVKICSLGRKVKAHRATLSGLVDDVAGEDSADEE